MSEYGADANPDLAKTYDLMVTRGFYKHNKANVMQWTGTTSRTQKIASRRDKTNVHIKFNI